MLSVSYPFFVLIMNFISLYDDGGKLNWKLVVSVPLVPLLLGVVLLNTLGRKVNDVGFLVEKYGITKTEKQIKKYYSEKLAFHKIEQYMQ
jgi:hypothetical protein